MFTSKRVSEAYKNAKVEYFDRNSKYVIFSDSHRGDDSLSDEFSRNQSVYLYALEYYYSRGYTYIEAGDGDELWEHKKFKYIRQAHGDVFRALKKYYDDKKFILLYGNHNIYLKNKHYVLENFYEYYDEYEEKMCDLFHGITPHEAVVLKNKDNNQEILILHGHQGDMMNDQFWGVSMSLMRYFWRIMHVVGFRNPSSPAKNLYKQHKIEVAYNKWIQKNKMMLVCGHTHRPKYPKNGELPYFNTGCCIHSRSITGIEIMDGKIMMVDWRIKADKQGNLKIERNIVRGPDPIERYDFKNNPSFEQIVVSNKTFDDQRYVI